MKRWQIALSIVVGILAVAFGTGFVLCTYVF